MPLTPERISVLVAGGGPSADREFCKAMGSRGMSLLRAECPEKVRRLALEECIDVALMDMEIASRNGFEVLRILQDYCPVTQIIILASEVSVEDAVESMKHGANDVICPPFDVDRICGLIQEAWRRRKILRENRLLRQEMRRRTVDFVIVGEGPAMKKVLEMAKKVGPTGASVLIQGETGVGKNLIARQIHIESDRRENPFVQVDCPTIPDTLFESDLFGHHKGSFSGADKLKYGLVEVSNKGTLFLDEIGEVPLTVQAKLLRVVETGTFRRLGGLRDQSVDMRIVASTNRSLMDLCFKGEFRQDLLYRLQVVTIEIPPLRNRLEDIPALTAHFLKGFSNGSEPKCLAPETLDLMCSYSWPGNVRELRNVLERAVILTERRTIRPKDMRSVLGKFGTDFVDAVDNSAPDVSLSLKTHEQHLIRKALVLTQGNRRRAAQILGIGERSLYRRLKEENIRVR